MSYKPDGQGGMKPSQPYAPSAPPPNAGYGGGYGGGYESGPPVYDTQRFKPKKRLKDPIFLVLFIAQVRLCFFQRLPVRDGRGGSVCYRPGEPRKLTQRAASQLAGFCVISGLVLSSWISQGGLGGGLGNGSETGSSITLNRCAKAITCYQLVFLGANGPPGGVRHTAYLLLLVAAAAFLLSVTQLMLTRLFTRMIMHITLILSIALNM